MDICEIIAHDNIIYFQEVFYYGLVNFPIEKSLSGRSYDDMSIHPELLLPNELL